MLLRVDFRRRGEVRCRESGSRMLMIVEEESEFRLGDDCELIFDGCVSIQLELLMASADPAGRGSPPTLNVSRFCRPDRRVSR